ncbi:hypothetical protein EDB85DRAFT_2153481 [Lactarius pseudohatsudake]|nr:hypothetical protein EDB85DRAFT_2153481 [Lactarius pseudohatsudake]
MFGSSSTTGEQTGTGTGTGTAPAEQPGQRPNADRVFGDVFEDLLRPEVERHLPLWAWLGAACGAGLGDAKGKSVAAVFAELGGAQKAEILRALVLKGWGRLIPEPLSVTSHMPVFGNLCDPISIQAYQVTSLGRHPGVA